MTTSKRLLVIALTLYVATATWGQERKAEIAYLYPGGTQKGQVSLIVAGGQLIRGANRVHITGEGVKGKIIQSFRPPKNVQKDQRDWLSAQIKEVRAMRMAERSGKSKAAAAKIAEKEKKSVPEPRNKLQHPALYNLKDKSLRELDHVSYQILFPRAMKQVNPQLEEMVLIEITADPGAAPGDRELRLETSTGLTPPMVFQVGQLPEVNELEPNNPKPWTPAAEKAPPLDLPVLLNGQIMPGDVDRFRIRAKKGQQLVMEVNARRLVPFLADAVPGWFQATLALFDEKGREIAFDDDYRFNPDPVLFVKIPDDGIYELEIHDAIYRGREDFVYRIAVGELPYITHAFPLGGQANTQTVAEIGGWNLTKKQMPLNTKPGGKLVRQAKIREKKYFTNEVTYAVDDLPDMMEVEPNNTFRQSQKVKLPKIVNGRIEKPGDEDIYQFKGKAGDKIVAEVAARRLLSPLDSVIYLTDAFGRVLEWNDDHEIKDGYLRKDMGLLTQPVDSYLTTELPRDGVYCLKISDSQRHGGEAFAYRLRLANETPDFDLRMTPSTINIPLTGYAPITIYAMRKNGFEGPIQITLKDRPEGFLLNGGQIPAGQDTLRLTLKAPAKMLTKPITLKLEGSVESNGKTIRRPVLPTDNKMQAFLWRHLAPSRELMVSVRKKLSGASLLGLASKGPVRVPMDGTKRVLVNTKNLGSNAKIQLQLDNPPAGVTLNNTKIDPKSKAIAFNLKVDGKEAEAGFSDNLIVAAYTEVSWTKKGTKQKQKRRVSLGVLPAIPFEITQK